jgi:uncharacterized protein YbjT (DUF2867 family)
VIQGNVTMNTILVAGATGQLGRHVVRELKRQGYAVRALTRSPARLDAASGVDEVHRGDLADPASLAGACTGVDTVISCAGASMNLYGFRDRRSFTAVDYRGNLNLLERARQEGVAKFVYVSLFAADRLMDTEYAAAHERFVAALRESGMRHAVVRPTGFFSFNAELVRMAMKGRGPVIGSGEARTNPVHEADLAGVCVSALTSDEAEIAVGGPEVYTRRRIVEMAFAAAGRPAKVMRVPGWVFRGIAVATRPVNPRIAALLEFGAAVSQVDVIAPATGTRSLDRYFAEVAGAPG